MPSSQFIKNAGRVKVRTHVFRVHAILLILLVCVFSLVAPETQAAQYKRIIIRNVTMIDPAEKTKDRIVDILIEVDRKEYKQIRDILK